MLTKATTIIVLAVVYMTTVFTTCEKVVQEPDKYSFQMNAEFAPDADSLKVNDHLSLQIEASTNLIDNNSGGMIDFSGAKTLVLRFILIN